jgi:ATP-dependent Clp protease adaptor protein ClpS
MMQVHRSEKAIVGSYSYDIAVSRVKKAMRLARQEGFPLRLEYKEE